MRGQMVKTNKSLFSPDLVMGCERIPFMLLCAFWVWAFMGVLPHIFGILVVLLGFFVTVYILKFAAKIDPQGLAVFKKNIPYMIQNRFFMARGYAGHVIETKKQLTVPLKLWTKV